MAVAVVAMEDPHRPGSYGVCPLYALTGLYCVGCGGLRATYDLAHADVVAAWGMNPLWVLLVPVLITVWWQWLVRRWRGASPAAGRGDAPELTPWVRRRWVPWTLLVFVVLFSVARNVPALVPWLAP